MSYPLAKASVVNYGLPDITSLGLSSAADHRRLRIAIETCLNNFEPRLSDVRVTLNVQNLLDQKQRVREEDGTTPLRYQPYLLDSLGRVVSLSLRKMF